MAKVATLRKRSGRQQQQQSGKFGITTVVFLFLFLLVTVYVVGLYFIFGNNGSSPNIADGTNNMNMNNNGAAVVKTQQDQQQSKSKATIGWAVTITGCGKDPITEGAAILKHAINLQSVHGKLGGRYDYKMYAIYHPDGYECASTLIDLGYTLVERQTPVAVKDIQGDFLRQNIEKNGCCGEKELVKLEAYTLIDHPIVVHLDLDVLVLKPMDALFDWMLSSNPNSHDTSNVPIMWPELPKPSQVNAFFTRDCKYLSTTKTDSVSWRTSAWMLSSAICFVCVPCGMARVVSLSLFLKLTLMFCFVCKFLLYCLMSFICQKKIIWSHPKRSTSLYKVDF